MSTGNGGAYVVRAASVTVGNAGDTLTQSAAGGVLLRALTGGVDFQGTLSLQAGAGNLVIDAFTNITGTTAPNLSNGTRPILLLRGDNSQPLALGNVTAGVLTNGQRDIVNPLLPADYSAASLQFQVGGNLTLGSLTQNAAIDIVASAGNIVLNSATSTTGAVSIVASAGSLTVGRTGNADSVASGGNGNVTLSALGAGNDATIRAGINAGTGAVAITGGQDVLLGRAAAVTQQGGTIAVTADRRIVGTNALTLQSSQAGGITLSAGTTAPGPGLRSIAFENASAQTANGGGAVTITAGANFNGLALGQVTGGSLVTPATITGAVDIRSLSIGGPLSLKNSGAMAIGSAVTTGGTGDITLDAGSTLVLGNADAGGSSGALNLLATAAGGSITVNATPTVNGVALAGLSGALDANGVIRVVSSGGISISGSVITTAPALTLDAGGLLSVGGQIRSRGRVVALGNDVTVAGVESRNDIVIVARVGDVVTGGLTIATPNVANDLAPVDGNGNAIIDPTTGLPIGALVGKIIFVRAGNQITLGPPAPSGGTVNSAAQILNLGNIDTPDPVIATGKRITGGTIKSGAEIVLTSTGTSIGGNTPDGLFLGSLEAGLQVALTSQTDIVVTGGIISSGGPTTVTALNGNATVGGAVTVGGTFDYIVRARAITVGTDGQTLTQSAGGGVLLQSSVGAITALGNLTLDANGTPSVVVPRLGQTVLDAATSIIGRPNLEANGNVLVRQGTVGTLALGNVTANQLLLASPVAAPALTPSDYAAAGPTLTNVGAITLGAVQVVGDLIISNIGGDFNISIEGASSSAGAVDIDSALDLLIGQTGQTRSFGAGPGFGLRLAAQRSILGSGTITLAAPTVSLEAGAIAPGAGPAPTSTLSIRLNGASITTTGATNVVARSAAFSGLTLGDVDAGSIDARISGAAIAGVNGAITTGALTSDSSLALTSLDNALSVGTVTVTNPASDIVLLAATSITAGGASATRDVRMTAAGGTLSLTGAVTAGQDIVLVSSGDMTATGELDATRDLKAKSGGALTFSWQSGNAALQSGAGRDVVIDAAQTSVAQIGAGDDLVLVARNGSLTTPDVVARALGDDSGGNITGADGAAVTNPRNAAVLGALPGRSLVLLATGNFGQAGDDLLCNANCVIGANDVTLRDISGSGGVRIDAGSITVRDVIVGGDIRLASSPGGITTRQLDTDGQVFLSSATSIDVTGNTRGAAVTMSSTNGNLTAADISAGAIKADAGNGTLTLGVLAATQVAGDAVRDGTIKLTATGTTGDIQLAGVTAASDLNVNASRDLTLSGPVAMTGNATLQAARTLSSGDIGLGTGALSATTTAGDINLGAVTANSIGATANSGKLTAGSLAANGGSITLTATRDAGAAAASTEGDIDVAGVTQANLLSMTAGRDIVVSQAITMTGNATLQAARDIVAGNIALGAAGNLSATAQNGNVTLGDVDGNGITATANSGKLDTGRLDGGAIALSATRDAGAAAGSTQGDIAVGSVGGLSVGRATSLTMTADRDVDVAGGIVSSGIVNLSAGRTLLVGSALAVGDEAINAGGNVTLGAGSNVDVQAQIIALGRAVAISAPAVATRAISAGSIAITGETSVGTGNLTAGNIDVRATNGIVTIADISGGTVLVQASSNTNVGDITTTNASVIVRAGQVGDVPGAGSGNLVVGNLLTGTGAITLRANNGTLTTGAISGGVVQLDATGPTGDISLDQVNQASSLTVRAGGSVTANSDIAITGAIDLKADQAVNLMGVINAASLIGDAGTTLEATGNIDVEGEVRLTGGTGVTVLDVNSRTNAPITLTATTGALSSGAISGGAVAIEATAGSASIGAVTRASSLSAKSGTTLGIGDIDIAGPATLNAGTDLTMASVTNAASLDAQAGQAITANGPIKVAGAATLLAGNGLTTGNVTSTANGAIAATATTGNAQLGTLQGGAIDVRALAGTLGIAGISASTSVLAQASGNTGIGDIASTGAVIVRAGQVGDTAGAASGNLLVGAVDAGSGAITLRANNGTLTAGTLGGGAIILESSGAAADMTLGGVSRSTSLVVTSGRAVTANGTLRTSGTASITTSRLDLAAGAELRSDGRLLIKAISGEGDVKLANGDGSLFDDADMPRVFAPVVQIDGNARNISIGSTTLFPNVLRVGVSTTKNITVVGAIKFESPAPPAADPGNLTAARILTLGGDATATDTSKVDEQVNGAANVMADRVVVETQTALADGSLTTGGQLIGTNSVIRVRGNYVALGMKEGARYIDALLGTTPLPATDVRARFTELPTSTFYLSIPSYANTGVRPSIVTANKLVLGVGQWGVIQNTGQSAQPGGGVNLNSVQLVNLGGASAPQGGPIVGFFGTLGGQEGIAAALRITVGQLGGITPNNVRINGCVALTTAGCIVTGLPLPLVQLNDPGRGLLIRNTPDLILPLELISGTTNEALWRDDEDLDPGRPIPAKPEKEPQTPSPTPSPARSGDGLP
ncbi:hypothetical protein [Sandarakinorhabdus oryzae]|uniref:hypothetical protein n=1 Tax=Sandarakinorhabdus oryzae TaxID=2675220 RepID=UPI001A9C69E4|nr:hypothetical protein [Sandarakinorhabdus oryzae]